ncbi:MAG: NUDIX domain-containing protein [Bacteroidia bacterium]
MSQLPPDGPNSWTTFASEQVYESPWIAVTKHDVLTPAQTPGTYSVVHFKNLAIGIIPIDRDGNTWLVGQYRYPLSRYFWEIIEGGGALDVDPLVSAQRELLEETGLRAAKWTKVMELHLSNSATDEHAIIYLAEELTEGQAEPEATEDLKVVKLPFREVYEMVLRGELTDAMTVAGVLRVGIKNIKE